MGQPKVDAVILDGAVIIQMLLPKTAQTFEEYFHNVFAPYILGQLQAGNGIDLVWDVYREGSLKRSTSNKRGSGQRQKVLPLTRIPSDWKEFLRVDDIKEYLFKLLASKVITIINKNVCSNNNLIDITYRKINNNIVKNDNFVWSFRWFH